MLQDPQVLGNDHNNPTSTMYFHNMSCDLLNKILFKPKTKVELAINPFKQNKDYMQLDFPILIKCNSPILKGEDAVM